MIYLRSEGSVMLSALRLLALAGRLTLNTILVMVMVMVMVIVMVMVMVMVIVAEFFWFYLCSAVQEGILRRSRKIKERADWPFGFDASPTLDLLLLPFGFVAGDNNCRQLFIVFAGIASLYKLNPGSRLEM